MLQNFDNTSISFQLAKRADLNTVCVNESKSYSMPWSRQNLLESIKGDYFVYLMKYHKEIIGHMILQQVLDETHLHNVCVIPEYQNKGLGKVWLEYLVTFAQKNASHFVFLEVRKSNHRAISLYSQVGFKSIAVRKAYYAAVEGREDGIVMELKLEFGK